MSRMLLPFALSMLLGVLPASAAPQAFPVDAAVTTDGAWSVLAPPDGRAEHTAVFDPARGQMVVFGGYEYSAPNYQNDVQVFSLTGNREWTVLFPAGTPPSVRRKHAAVYDPVRDLMVVFGGYGPGSPIYRSDVWALSFGASPAWSQITPTGTPPSGRWGHSAIYDPVRDRVVVFGGTDGTYKNDVWALSLGAAPEWTQLAPSGTPPSARSSHTAIYDPVRDRMVVFGGTDGAYKNDVWALSLGAAPEWTQFAPSGTLPSARSDHSSIYDPAGDRMVVFGEWDGYTALKNDLWSLSLGDAPAWTELAPTGTPASGRWGHTAIYNSIDHEMVIFGGYPNYANDAWALSLGASPAWTEVTPLGTAPAGRSFHAAIYDPIRDRVVVSGGYPHRGFQVWAFALGGSPRWTRLNPSGTPPSGRKNHTTIYDPVRDRMIVFGGFLTYPDDPNLALSLNDVWALSLAGTPAWTQLIPSGTPPSKRDAHTAIYDPLRDRMIVFAGWPKFGNDVWALSLAGTPEWTQLAPTGTPPVGRYRHTAIYDPIRDRMVVFGGYKIDFSCLNDTWALALSGTPAWTELLPSGTPPGPRGRHSAVYDPARDRMVVFGAYDCSYQYLNDSWALSLGDPPAWTQLAPSGTLPSGRSGHSAVYDPVRDQMVMIGGMGPYHLDDVWSLAWGPGSCAVPEIVSYEPALLTVSNCAAGCTVTFVVGTSGDYSGVSMLTLERYLQGTWVPVDSLVAPLPPPTWTLYADIDQHYTDGEHVFRARFRCADGSTGVSGTAIVVADRGVPVAIQRFEPRVSPEGVVLHWSLADGTGLQGFNIYRSFRQDEGFERLNAELLPAERGNEYTDNGVAPGRIYYYRLGAVDAQGEWMSVTVSVTVPGLFLALHQNVPNPFNPTTSISFVLPQRSPVTLAVYDVQGRRVKTLVDAVVEAGVTAVDWDGTDERGDRVSSGIYFYRLRCGDGSLTRKLLLLR